ncbi:MAG: polyprenyl synthetase family protein [Pseudomonadota bacterium]
MLEIDRAFSHTEPRPMETTAEIEALKKKVDDGLESMLSGMACPEILKNAMSHSVLAGGKRLRPLITIAACRLFDKKGIDPVPAACAIEFIHTYSLIHDDLPAMDNDSLRRGVPTCHIVFGEAMAILAGDALLTEAFNIVSRAYCDHPETACAAMREIASAAGAAGMVGGQVYDIMNEQARHVEGGTAESDGEDVDLFRIHEMKTGALLKACFVTGGIIGGGGGQDLDRLAQCGGKVGLAFQVIDDCLDATGTDQQLGKNAGSDAAKGKRTFIDLMGRKKAMKLAGELEKEALSLIAPYKDRGDLLGRLIRKAVEREF